jgi:hypothetical protein
MEKENKPIDLSDPLIERVIEALKRGNMLEAVLQYRTTHDAGLTEAKREVDKIAEKLGL